MTDRKLPEGSGVRCGDCATGERVSTNPPQYQEKDPRLQHLFRCPKQPGWKRIHEDLVHRCEQVSPKGGEAKLYPLPLPVERMALEQTAADPGNDRISAAANANQLHSLPRHEAYKRMSTLKSKNALFGEMVESFYNEIDRRNQLSNARSRARQK